MLIFLTKSTFNLLASALGILMIGSALGGKSILYYIDAHFIIDDSHMKCILTSTALGNKEEEEEY